MRPTPSVLIVGVGLAGLAAACELERRGCMVIVVEAATLFSDDFAGFLIVSEPDELRVA